MTKRRRIVIPVLLVLAALVAALLLLSKYGLAVTGFVDPHRMLTNSGARPGDVLVLTKALGVGLICTANRVGEELHTLGRHRQILCISHLAQVAARADRHYCVVKHTEGDRTFSESRLLNDRERAAEIARMLGGGDSALVHARSILRNLRATRD